MFEIFLNHDLEYNFLREFVFSTALVAKIRKKIHLKHMFNAFIKFHPPCAYFSFEIESSIYSFDLPETCIYNHFKKI